MRIIPNQGVCGPHVHIFGGKAWLFSTHDRGPGNPMFRMDDWRIFSSDDLLNWRLECTVHPEDTYLGRYEDCCATDAAERGGKHYFYFSEGQTSTGVMVSENGPAGPWRDAPGKPLLPAGLADTPSYDPTAFIDDDEARTPYIMWGYTCFGKKYYIARLNADLTILASPVPGTPCSAEIREGGPFGRVLGCCRIGGSEEPGPDGFAEIPCRLENKYGSHGLCFVFRGEGAELLRFGGFRFGKVRD